MIKSRHNSLTAAGVLALAVSALLPLAQAGDWGGKEPKAPVEPTLDPIGAKVSVGYDSQYYFRGLWFSSNNVWSSVTASKELSDTLALDLLTYYTDSASDTSGFDPSYSELDLGLGLTYDAGFASFRLGYTYYYFFNQFFGNDVGQHYAHEVGLSTVIPVGMFNIGAGYYYDLFFDAHYFQGSIDTTIAVTDRFSIVPAATIGYSGSNYYASFLPGLPFSALDTDAFTHVGVNVSFPFQVTENVVFAPYVATNFSMDAREGLNPDTDDIWGGFSLTVSF
jgi:hypothetical protein